MYENPFQFFCCNNRALLFIPHICPYWFTIALFRTVKVHQKMRKFATKKNKIGQKGQNFAFSILKINRLEKSTPPPAEALGTNMSYVAIVDQS